VVACRLMNVEGARRRERGGTTRYECVNEDIIRVGFKLHVHFCITYCKFSVQSIFTLVCLIERFPTSIYPFIWLMAVYNKCALFFHFALHFLS
jgi:hypothetical protein